jgi:hypothetical protein
VQRLKGERQVSSAYALLVQQSTGKCGGGGGEPAIDRLKNVEQEIVSRRGKLSHMLYVFGF